MKLSAMIRYTWNGLCHKRDRVFSMLNILSVAMTILILVVLTGLLKSFKDYSENILSKLPLCIDIFKSKQALFQDITSIEPEIRRIPGVTFVAKRVPAFITFMTSQGAIVTPQGTTVPNGEPLALFDIAKRPLRFLPKGDKHFAEIGIIASFALLKKLEYLPIEALPDQPQTWNGKTIPEKLKIQVTDNFDIQNPIVTELPVPLVGVVPELARGDYVITEDFYTIILRWRHAFRYLLKDRHQQPLMVPKAEITKAYYVLTGEQEEWLQDNYEILLDIEDQYQIQVFPESWEVKGGFEERLTFVAGDKKITMEVLETCMRKLRSYSKLATLKNLKTEKSNARMATWDDFPPITYRHQYMQASVYVENRPFIRPALQKLRNMGLFASSPLERYLNNFERQENFFVGATVAIFILILFLSGIVLFSTFYTAVQRKRNQIGIFKAFGASSALVRKTFYLESALIALLGSALGNIAGLRLGEYATNWINQLAHFTDNQLVFSVPIPYLLFLSLFICIFCWIATFIPSWIASNTDPAHVLRN